MALSKKASQDSALDCWASNLRYLGFCRDPERTIARLKQHSRRLRTSQTICGCERVPLPADAARVLQKDSPECGLAWSMQ